MRCLARHELVLHLSAGNSPSGTNRHVFLRKHPVRRHSLIKECSYSRGCSQQCRSPSAGPLAHTNGNGEQMMFCSQHAAETCKETADVFSGRHWTSRALSLISYSRLVSLELLSIFDHQTFSLWKILRESKVKPARLDFLRSITMALFPLEARFQPASFLCHYIIVRLEKEKSIWTISKWFAFD